jgi:hypothetical protein
VLGRGCPSGDCGRGDLAAPQWGEGRRRRSRGGGRGGREPAPRILRLRPRPRLRVLRLRLCACQIWALLAQPLLRRHLLDGSCSPPGPCSPRRICATAPACALETQRAPPRPPTRGGGERVEREWKRKGEAEEASRPEREMVGGVEVAVGMGGCGKGGQIPRGCAWPEGSLHFAATVAASAGVATVHVPFPFCSIAGVCSICWRWSK